MIKPTKDRILIKPIESMLEKESNIIMLNNKKSSKEAIVIAVGNGRILANGTRKEPDVNPGDIIIYNKTVAIELEDEGQKFLLINESDILAVVELEEKEEEIKAEDSEEDSK